MTKLPSDCMVARAPELPDVPDAHIGALITPGSAAALSRNDSVDEILLFDKFAFDRPSDALRNSTDARKLTSTAFQKHVAKAIATAMVSFVG